MSYLYSQQLNTSNSQFTLKLYGLKRADLKFPGSSFWFGFSINVELFHSYVKPGGHMALHNCECNSTQVSGHILWIK